MRRVDLPKARKKEGDEKRREILFSLGGAALWADGEVERGREKEKESCRCSRRRSEEVRSKLVEAPIHCAFQAE